MSDTKHLPRLIVASNNQNKIREFRAILGARFELVSMSEAGIDADIEENGTTFEENSLLKAEAVMKASGLPVLADDSGLMVDALHGAPGVYSARYGHKNSDAERVEYLLENMKNVPDEARTAKFVCVITCLWPDGRKIVARGECPGRILHEVHGSNGFGYDPLFRPEGYEVSFGQLPAEEKNRISHRAKALILLREKLKELNG